MSDEAVVVARDLMMRARLEGAARAAGFDVVAASVLPAQPPALVLADLDDATALATVTGWREQLPALRVVGFLSHVDRERWETAEAAGIEVYPRGASASRAAEIIGRATPAT